VLVVVDTVARPMKTAAIATRTMLRARAIQRRPLDRDSIIVRAAQIGVVLLGLTVHCAIRLDQFR